MFFQDSKPYFLSQLYIINTRHLLAQGCPKMCTQNLTSGFDNLFLTFVVAGGGGGGAGERRMGKRGELNQDVAFNPSAAPSWSQKPEFLTWFLH